MSSKTKRKISSVSKPVTDPATDPATEETRFERSIFKNAKIDPSAPYENHELDEALREHMKQYKTGGKKRKTAKKRKTTEKRKRR